MLARLAADRFDGVREAASHRGLDAGMLDAFAADSHEVVRSAARRRSLA